MSTHTTPKYTDNNVTEISFFFFKTTTETFLKVGPHLQFTHQAVILDS